MYNQNPNNMNPQYNRMLNQQQRQMNQQQRQINQQQKAYQRELSQQERLYTQQQRQSEREFKQMQRQQEKEYNQYMKQQQLPRLTKAVAEQFISQYVGYEQFRLQFVRLTEQPTQWKHSCTRTGVAVQKPITIFYGETEVQFAFCRKCGKIHYYFEAPYNEINIPDQAFNNPTQAPTKETDYPSW